MLISVAISLVIIIRLSRICWQIRSTSCYSLYKPIPHINDMNTSYYKSFHPFVNFPLAHAGIMALYCHSSVNITTFTPSDHRNRMTERCCSFIRGTGMSWRSHLKNNDNLLEKILQSHTIWDSSTLKTEAVSLFQMSVPTYQTTRCHNPEDHNKILRYHENHKSQGKIYPRAKLFEHHTMKTYGGAQVYISIILGLGTRWGWVVSLKPLQGYFQTTPPRYRLYRADAVEKIAPARNLTPPIFLGRPFHSVVTISTELSRLPISRFVLFVFTVFFGYSNTTFETT
jgi:hypothetical protein